MAENANTVLVCRRGSGLGTRRIAVGTAIAKVLPVPPAVRFWDANDRREREARMVGLKRRSVVVTFRVSADEHEALKAGCLKASSRSVADFVRAAAMQKAESLRSGGGGNLSGNLISVTEGLRDLDAILGDIRKRIRGILGRGGAGRADLGVMSDED